MRISPPPTSIPSSVLKITWTYLFVVSLLSTVPSENALMSEATTGTVLVPATHAASIKAIIFFLRSFNPIFFFSFIIWKTYFFCIARMGHNHELCPALPVGILYKITQMDYFTVIFLRLDHGLNTFLPFSEVLLNACIPTVQLPFGTFLNVAVTVPSLRFSTL